jgi:hypothetical protein
MVKHGMLMVEPVEALTWHPSVCRGPFFNLIFLVTLYKKTTIVIRMSTRAYIQSLSSIGPIFGEKIFEVVERWAAVDAGQH